MTRVRRSRYLQVAEGLFLSLAAGLSCMGHAPEVTNVVTDSAGVRILEFSGSRWGVDVGWELHDVPQLQLTRSAGAAGDELYEVSGAVRFEDGDLAVAVSGAREISFYDADGTPHTAVGGDGEGPGQFRDVTSLVHYGVDSIAVMDRRLRRLTLLDDRGRLGRVITLPASMGVPISLVSASRRGFVLRSADVDAFDQRAGPTRLWEHVVILDESGAIVDTVAAAAGQETFVFELGDAQLPFAKKSHVAVRGDAVVIGDAERLQFRVYRIGTAGYSVVRMDGPDLSIDPVLRREAQSEILQRRAPPQYPDLPRVVADAIPVEKPAYDRLLIDSEGGVWLREFEADGEADGPRRWFVFAADGRWNGFMRLPRELEPYQIDADFILGRWEEDTGLESVRLFALERQVSD